MTMMVITTRHGSCCCHHQRLLLLRLGFWLLLLSVLVSDIGRTLDEVFFTSTADLAFLNVVPAVRAFKTAVIPKSYYEQRRRRPQHQDQEQRSYGRPHRISQSNFELRRLRLFGISSKNKHSNSMIAGTPGRAHNDVDNDTTMSGSAAKTKNVDQNLPEGEQNPYGVIPPCPRRDENSNITIVNNNGKYNITNSSTTKDEVTTTITIPNPYGWMRDDQRQDLEVLEYINFENNYTRSVMSAVMTRGNGKKDVQNEIRNELLSYYHVKEDEVVDEKDSDEDNKESSASDEGRELGSGHSRNRKGKLSSLPWVHGDYYYYSRTMKGKSLPIHYRISKYYDDGRKLISHSEIVDILQGGIRGRGRGFGSNNVTAAGAAASTSSSSQRLLEEEHIILDENLLAQYLRSASSSNSSSPSEYFAIHSMVPSPSNKRLAISVDITGDETYQLYLLDLADSSYFHPEEQEIPLKLFMVDHDMSGPVVWGNDDKTLYYLQADDRTKRPYRLYQWIDKDNSSSSLLHEEKDPSYWCDGLYKSSDQRYVFLSISSPSTETSETWYIDLLSRKLSFHRNGSQDFKATQIRFAASTVGLQCVAKRRLGIHYRVEHRHGKWWIVSNHNTASQATNNSNHLRIWIAPAIEDSQKLWRCVQLKKDQKQDNEASSGRRSSSTLSYFDGGILDPSIEKLVVFSSIVVVQGRQDGIPRIWILAVDDKVDDSDDGPASGNDTGSIITYMERLDFDHEPAHYVNVETNKPYQDFRSSSMIISYQSLVTPPQYMEIALSISCETDQSEHQKVLWKESIPGYCKGLYGCHRCLVPSRDGHTMIPVSIVYRKQEMECKQDGKGTTVGYEKSPLQPKKPSPLHLLGYGAYGHSLEAAFSPVRLALLNRGVICALAHVRGGGELGQSWYESGKGNSKMNSINDFVDVSRWLIDNGWTTPQQLACEGRSAGGLLVAAAINQAPNLFRFALLGVPFLDIVSSMTDSSLPLSEIEGDEWGDVPYMMKYDPILNIPSKEGQGDLGNWAYPSCLSVAGLNDPRAPYWDSLKFTATLRNSVSSLRKQNQQTSYRFYCVKIDTNAGHSWGSDRDKYCDELALMYTFLLYELGHC